MTPLRFLLSFNPLARPVSRFLGWRWPESHGHDGPMGPFYSPEMALVHATHEGNAERVALLATRKRALHRTPSSQTALMAAAGLGQLDCARVLLPLSDAQAKDSQGDTPLMMAARAGKTEMVSLLLDASDACAVNKAQSNALMLAVENGHADCARLLLPHCGLGQANVHGLTALMSSLFLGSSPECFDLVFPLSDIFLRDRRGNTALMLAAAADSSHALARLLAADPKGARLANNDGMTALMFACQSPSPQCVALLLPFSEPRAEDNEGATALNWAVRNGGLPCVKALDAAFDFEGGDGRQILKFLGASNPNPEIMKIADWIAARAELDAAREFFGGHDATALPQTAARLESVELMEAASLPVSAERQKNASARRPRSL